MKNGQMQVVCMFVCPRTSSSRRSASSKPTCNYFVRKFVVKILVYICMHSERVNTNRCKFAGTVIDQFANANMASQRGDRHDVSTFLLDHFGQKRFCGLCNDNELLLYQVCVCVCACVSSTNPKVCHNIHIERTLDQMVRRIQQMQPRHNSSIVDQQGNLQR